jgi:hypothetical protein
VTEGFEPALLGRYHLLPRGLRVCLRLARPRDAEGIADLFWTQGREPDELELARLVRFDPRRRLVICATALIDSLETIVGVGEIDLRAGPEAGPDLVLVDELRTAGLQELLSQALTGRARLLRGDHAA